MKWIGFFLLILVALVILMVLIGACLPKEHEITRSLSLLEPPEAVYTLIRDLEHAPVWRKNLHSIEILSDDQSHVSYVESSSDRKIKYHLLEAQPYHRMVTQIADDRLPFGGMWTFQIEKTTQGCTLSITEHGFVKNPLFRFLARFVFGYQTTVEQYLKDVNSYFSRSPSST